MESAHYGDFLTTKFDNVVNWARKFSLFQYPFVTACCGMEYMSASCSHYDVSRFGAEIPRFSPRQSDVLWVELQNRIQNDGPSALQGSINSAAINHMDQKKLQLSRFLEIPENEVVENVQNPKSNRSTKPGYSYSKDYINTNSTMGYDTPKGRRDKDNLKTG